MKTCIPNTEFTHQIKVCDYLKAKKADCIEQKYTPGVSTYTEAYSAHFSADPFFCL